VRNCISDMDALIGATQRIGICDLAEFSNFYQKFCTIVEYLSSQNRIGNREISTNFICALLADLQHKIMFCNQVSNTNWHVGGPHTLKLLFDAGVHILKGNTILDTMNPYAVAAVYAQPPNPAVQQPQVVQQSPVNYLQNAYIPGTSILLPNGYYQPLTPFPYYQQTVPVQPPAPATPQPNAYQSLPYTPGLKQEDIMTIATTVALAFAKQLTPLFQQQPRGNTGQNNGQNRGAFTCPFCRQAGHGIHDCKIAQTYVTENRVRCENGKFVMPDGSQIARSQPCELLKECIDQVQQVRTSVVFKIISPAAQEALDNQVTSQVNIQMQIDSEAEDEIDANIKAYKYTIFKLRKKKQKFDGVELPTCSKGRAPAVALPPKQAAAPKPTAPAQPAPAIIPKPAKPFVLTTFEAPKQPQEPNFRYTAPIKDRAIGNTLFNRMLDTQIMVTARKILSTIPEVRKSFKDTTTMRKVPTLANPAKVDVDTNTQSANQVQLCCHKVHHNLLIAKESHLLRAITPKIEGLHKVECILDSGSQIVSISKVVWQMLNRELNPCWKFTLQSANGSRNKSLGLVENLELKIGSMKLHVQAHVIRNPAYDILLGRPFDILTALHIKNYRNKLQTITITNPNSGKMVSIPTVPCSQPCFKSPPPEDIHQESF
jgi:hypothetical protein